jgi:uncharacterized protein YndB with AHSA1/START domain
MTSTTKRDGQLVELEDDRVGVRFERRLAHPPDRVWRAITEPEQLAKWFPARPEISGDREVGAQLRFVYPRNESPPEAGEVIELEEHRVFAFTWRPDAVEERETTLRFELAPDGNGTKLTFTHELPRPDTAKVAAGWQLCLDDLELALGAEPQADFPADRWVELHEGYAEQFGVSPEAGRKALRDRQASR